MIKDFVLSSDYPIDQVIYRSETIAVSVNGYDYKDVAVPHTAGGFFLPIVQFSTSSDFSQNVFDINASGFGNNGDFQYLTGLDIDDNSIYINTINRTDTAVTFYFRVIGFALSDDRRKFPFTSHYHNMTFNTNSNQLKLYKAGSATVAVNQSIQIPHKLGYKPLTLLWVERNGRIEPLTYAALDQY